MSHQNAIEKVLNTANLSSITFAYGYIYPQWEVEEILVGEMFRDAIQWCHEISNSWPI